MKHLIYSTLVAFAVTACSSATVEEPTRPYMPEETSGDSTDNEQVEDLSAELADKSNRFTSATLRLYYSTPGTLFMQSNDEIRVIDITTGNRVSFNTDYNTLYINGEEVELTAADIVKEDDTTTWYRLLSSDAERIIIVIDR